MNGGARTAQMVANYVKGLGADLLPTALLLRQPDGRPWAQKDSFGQEFRLQREIWLPGDRRQFQDLRRSGNTEAWVGGEDRVALAQALGNGIDKSDRLWETYAPPTLAAAREVMAAREIGRACLKAGAHG